MKTVFVTGGTRGIGEGIARALAHAGYRVIAASHSETERAAFTRSEQIELRHIDVTDTGTVSQAFADLDRLDGLVELHLRAE